MIRETQVEAIDAAHRTLSAARGTGGETAADSALNAVVRDSSPEEINAWASRANERDSW